MTRRLQGFVQTAGAELFYRDWGSGPAFVFVSSWSLASDAWCYQMLGLCERGLRCIAFDRRGHGRSSDPGRGYDFDTLADDLAAVLEALDVREAVLVGHSMGNGEIVRQVSRHGCGRVAGIAMLGSTTPMVCRSDDHPQGIDPDYFEAFRATQLMRNLPRWLDENLGPFLNPDTLASFGP